MKPGATDPGDVERFDDQGVDLTLVRYTLALTPTERLKALENFMNAMASVRPAPRREPQERDQPPGAPPGEDSPAGNG